MSHDDEQEVTCGNCPNELDSSFGKALGCYDCDEAFCSATCLEAHEAATGHGENGLLNELRRLVRRGVPLHRMRDAIWDGENNLSESEIADLLLEIDGETKAKAETLKRATRERSHRIRGARLATIVALSLASLALTPGLALAQTLVDNPKPKPKPVLVLLTVSQASLAFADVAFTQSVRRDYRVFTEHDPLAREVVKHPALAYGLAGAETVGAAWLGGRMRRSQRWHRVWWLPQTIGIAGHAYALGRTAGRQH
jgi:hypothetical protein